MGCIFCKREEEEDIHSLLLPQFKCFVCNNTFANNIEYNRHIPNCKINKYYTPTE